MAEDMHGRSGVCGRKTCVAGEGGGHACVGMEGIRSG